MFCAELSIKAVAFGCWVLTGQFVDLLEGMILSALLTSIGINLGLCLLFFTLYSILRKQPGNVTVYAPRLVAEHETEQSRQFNLESLLPSPWWVRQAWQPTEEELLSLLGLDAVVFMRIFIFRLLNILYSIPKHYLHKRYGLYLEILISSVKKFFNLLICWLCVV